MSRATLTNLQWELNSILRYVNYWPNENHGNSAAAATQEGGGRKEEGGSVAAVMSHWGVVAAAVAEQQRQSERGKLGLTAGLWREKSTATYHAFVVQCSMLSGP